METPFIKKVKKILDVRSFLFRTLPIPIQSVGAQIRP